MKIFLCGQGPAAESVLRSHLTPATCEQVAVFTHPGAAIFDQARAWQIPHSLQSVNDVELWPFEPDIIVSIYYRTIIEQHVINRVNGRIFNAHTSLLPRHRGRSPIPWAIIEGDQHTGVTYHYIDKGIDTGRIILQAACQITPKETQASLFEKINALAVAYFPAALALALAGFPGVEQRGEAVYHFAGCPHRGEINHEWSMPQIERFIRAMVYPPLPYAKFRGREIKTIEDYRIALYEINPTAENFYRNAYAPIRSEGR